MRNERGRFFFAAALAGALALLSVSCGNHAATPPTATPSGAPAVAQASAGSGGCAVSNLLVQVQTGGSCSSGSSASPSASGSSSASPSNSASCLPASVTQGTPTTVTAHITGYGWPDNSPPGAVIAQSVIHQTAGGDGSYCNPITFATETANDTTYPFGTLLYVSALQRYFIREDTCAGCTGVWFDLWVGGSASDNANSVLDCEGSFTADGVQVIVHPPSTEPVINPAAPIFNNGACDP